MKYLNISIDGVRYLCVTDGCRFYVLGRTGLDGQCQDHSTMRCTS